MLGFAPLASIPLADDGATPPVVYYPILTAIAEAEANSIVNREISDQPDAAEGAGSFEVAADRSYSAVSEAEGAAEIEATVSKAIDSGPLIPIGAGSAVISPLSAELSIEVTLTGVAYVSAVNIREFAVGEETATGVAYTGGRPPDPEGVEIGRDISSVASVVGIAESELSIERSSTVSSTALGESEAITGAIAPVSYDVEISVTLTGAGEGEAIVLHDRPDSSGTAEGLATIVVGEAKISDAFASVDGVAEAESFDVHLIRVTAGSTKDNSDSWTDQDGSTVDIFTAINELVPDDADYIKSPAILPEDPATSYEFRFGHLTTPLSNDYHRFRARIKRANEGILNAQIELFCDATPIASWTYLDVDQASFVDVDEEITPLQAANITDYSQLWVRITAEAP